MDNYGQLDVLKSKTLKDCTGNKLLIQKVREVIKVETEKMLNLFGRTNLKTVDTYTDELMKLNFTATQVSDATAQLIKTHTMLPTILEIKAVLGVQPFKKKRPKFHQEQNERAAKDKEEYFKLRDTFLETFTEEDLRKWNIYYCVQVFGKSILSLEFLKCFEQISLKDLQRSNMNKEKAIEIGKRALMEV